MGGNDLVYGNVGNDLLYGDDGNDIIQGGPGSDTLYGGAGNDAYLFTSGEGADIIVEMANEGTQDQLYCASDITSLSLAQNGNDLYFFANDNDFAVLYGWFTNQAVEYVTLQATGYSYLVSDLVAAYLPPAANAALTAMNDAGVPDFSSAQVIDFDDIPAVDWPGHSHPERSCWHRLLSAD